VTAKLKTMGELFMGRRPEREIIVPCVRWRLRNKLSLRDRFEKKATGDPSGPPAPRPPPFRDPGFPQP
jgi:hypothetical protein